MAQQIKIKFISEGFQEILQSEGVRSAVESATYAIQDNANANNVRGGEGFASSVRMAPAVKSHGNLPRWIGQVYTTDHASMVAEAEDKALSRAV